MARLSKESIAKKGRGGPSPFSPDIKAWKKICGLSAYDTQIQKYFGISQETFYAFLDRERYKQEQDPKYRSEFLESHKAERNKTKEMIANKFLEKIQEGDTSSVIFGMKTYNGMIEAQFHKIIELKKIEVAFKTKQFLTELGSKFNLNYEELNAFAEKFFKDSKIEDV